jgi:hypothetical protein
LADADYKSTPVSPDVQAVACDSYEDFQPTSSLENPTISRVIPNTGPVTGGIEIALIGSHFLPSSRCIFGSEAVSVTWQGEDSLVCILPPARKPGLVPVTVSAGGPNTDCNDDTSLLFTYQDNLYKEL